mgnify:CR=1 FL=1
MMERREMAPVHILCYEPGHSDDARLKQRDHEI